VNADPDTTRIVRSWLEEGVTALPDRVLDAVLDQLPTTPQRRITWWPARRFQNMNTSVKLGLAAAVVVVAALLGFNYFAAPNVGSGGLDNSIPTPTPTPAPTATPIPNIPDGDTLEAGTYRANPFIPVEVLVNVPDGWIGGGDWLLFGPRGVEPPDGMNIRFGSVSRVFANPLNAQDGFLDPPVGPTVDDLVDAMLSHPDWPTSPPTDVTIDGYAGKVVRMTLPPELEIPENRFLLFQDGQSGDRWAFEQGQIIDFYIIDVDGQRLVLELFSYPDTPAEDLAARQAVVDALQLAPLP